MTSHPSSHSFIGAIAWGIILLSSGTAWGAAAQQDAIVVESIRYDASAHVVELVLMNPGQLDITAFSIELVGAASTPIHSETVDLIEPLISRQLGSLRLDGRAQTLNSGERLILPISRTLPEGLDVKTINVRFPMIIFSNQSFSGRKAEASRIAEARENSWRVATDSFRILSQWVSEPGGDKKIRECADGVGGASALQDIPADTRSKIRWECRNIVMLLNQPDSSAVRKYMEYQSKRLSKLREAANIQGAR